MLTKAKEVMNAMVTGIVTIVKEIPQKIYNSISGAISKVATWGTEVKNKAVEGMKNVITGITDVFKDIGSTFAGSVKHGRRHLERHKRRYEVDKEQNSDG